MDYVGKTEFLNENLAHIGKYLPKHLTERLGEVVSNPLNKSNKKGIIIDKNTVARVRDIYDADFEFFGYERWETRDSIETLIK